MPIFCHYDVSIRYLMSILRSVLCISNNYQDYAVQDHKLQCYSVTILYNIVMIMDRTLYQGSMIGLHGYYMFVSWFIAAYMSLLFQYYANIIM